MVTSPVALRFTAALGSVGQVDIAAWAFVPRNPNDLLPALWMFCIPGATYRGLAYFDRQVVPDFVPSAYSMARHFASEGIGSVVIDNLGTGASPCPLASEEITVRVLAAAYEQVVEQLRTRLATGKLVDGLAALPQESLWLAGVGHSMGAFILTYLQSDYPAFDGVVELGMAYQPENVAAFMAGFGGRDLVGTMVEQYRIHAGDEAFARASRAYARQVFYSRNVPATLIKADERDATVVPVGLFREVYAESVEAAAKAAQIHGVPVYLGFGQLELPFPHKEAASFSGANDITLFILPQAAHCANFAQNRQTSWNSLTNWFRAKARYTRSPLNPTYGRPIG